MKSLKEIYSFRTKTMRSHFCEAQSLDSQKKKNSQYDSFEQEADVNAEQVVVKKRDNLNITSISGSRQIQQKNALESNNESIDEQIESKAGTGQKLSAKDQNEMESGFGTDLSNVRIHITMKGDLEYQQNENLKKKGSEAVEGVKITFNWTHSNGKSGTGVLTNYKEVLLQGKLVLDQGGSKIDYRTIKLYT